MLNTDLAQGHSTLSVHSLCESKFSPLPETSPETAGLELTWSHCSKRESTGCQKFLCPFSDPLKVQLARTKTLRNRMAGTTKVSGRIAGHSAMKSQDSKTVYCEN